MPLLFHLMAQPFADCEWYRCVLTEKTANGFNMKFIDYGNSAVLTNAHILPLSRDLLNHSPMAYACQLAGMYSVLVSIYFRCYIIYFMYIIIYYYNINWSVSFLLLLYLFCYSLCFSAVLFRYISLLFRPCNLASLLERFDTKLVISRWLGAGHSSGGEAPICKGLDHPIDPAQQMHLQYGLFSVSTSGPQLVHQRLWYVLSCVKVLTTFDGSLLDNVIFLQESFQPRMNLGQGLPQLASRRLLLIICANSKRLNPMHPLN